jgi:hypothetical protein
MANELRNFTGVLSRMGRGGGVVALCLGTPLAAFGAYALLTPTVRDKHNVGIVLAAGVLLVGSGVHILVTGGGPSYKPLERAELLRRLRANPVPFSVCSQCFLLLPFGRECPRCGESLSWVTTETERQGVARGLEL